MRFHPLPGALLLLPSLLAGCKSDRPPAETTPSSAPAASAATPSAPAAITVTASEYKLDLPAQIQAGAVTLHLVNHGKELHQAQIIRLDDGKTVADFAKAMKENGPPPSWVKFVGGPNGIAPGTEGNTAAALTPGHYAVLCFIPGLDGHPSRHEGDDPAVRGHGREWGRVG
jgi:hypothetical protein